MKMLIRPLLLVTLLTANGFTSAYADSSGGLSLGAIGDMLVGQRETLVDTGLAAMNLAPETLQTVKPMVHSALDSGIAIMNKYNYDPSDTSSIDGDSMSGMKQELGGVTDSLGGQLSGVVDDDKINAITQLVAAQFP